MRGGEKKCPFCGGEPMDHRSSLSTAFSMHEWRLGCPVCQVWFEGDSLRQVQDSWNRRAVPVETGAHADNK